MAQKTITPISTLNDAIAYIKEHATMEATKAVLKKQDTANFMTACGVPPAAFQQVQDAESLLIRGLFQTAQTGVIDQLNEAVKKGTDKEELYANPCEFEAKAIGMGGTQYRINQSSSRASINPKTGDSIVTYGRARLTVDMTRLIPKEERTALADACKAAMGD